MVDDNPSPVAIGWAASVADPAGRLFAAWNGNHNRPTAHLVIGLDRPRRDLVLKHPG